MIFDKNIIEKIKQVLASFERQTGRVPSIGEIAEKLGTDAREIKKVILEFLGDDKLEGTSAFQSSLLEILVDNQMWMPEIDHINEAEQLSPEQTIKARGWLLLEEQKKNGDTIRARVSAVIAGGVTVDVYRLRGFVPDSQLCMKGTTPEELVGMEIPMKILEVDMKRNKLVLSQRLAVQEEGSIERNKTLRELRIGQTISGEVVRIADFGAFIDLGGGLEGLVPISEISQERVSHPSDILTVGQIFTTKILKVNCDKGHISLSLK